MEDPIESQVASTKVSTELDRAIAALYAAFSFYKLAPRVEGCSHCVSDDDDALIHSAPLRQLGPAALERYAFKAMTTWGSEDDFRHFLPRLFELVVLDGGEGWISPETLFGNLDYAEWTNWPHAEQNAIVDFQRALWRDVLSRFPHPFEVDRCLRSIAQVTDDVAEYLLAWDVGGSIAAACHFALFLESGITRTANGWKLPSWWWRERPLAVNQITQWLLAPERSAELERSFFALTMEDQALQELVLNGMDQLLWIRTVAVP